MIKILLKEAKYETQTKSIMKIIFPQILKNFGKNFTIQPNEQNKLDFPLEIVFKKNDIALLDKTLTVSGTFFHTGKIIVYIKYNIKEINTNDLYYKLSDIIQHEITHGAQFLQKAKYKIERSQSHYSLEYISNESVKRRIKSVSLKELKRLSSAIAQEEYPSVEEYVYETLEDLFANYEIEAYARGFYYSAKKQKKNIIDLIQERMNDFPQFFYFFSQESINVLQVCFKELILIELQDLFPVIFTGNKRNTLSK